MAKRYILAIRDFRRLRYRALQAQRRDQSEICGALFEDGAGRLQLVFLTNRSTRPGHMEILYADLRNTRETARSSGLRFAGTFHSHPVGFAKPGATDLAGPLRQIQLIFDVSAREARLWKITQSSKGRTAVELPLAVDLASLGR